MSLLAFESFILTALSWTTSQEQIKYLLDKKDFQQWETFRNSLVSRWANGNVVCGLIMSAISTILFSSFTISNAAFALGVISLLSSLIAIGFGVGLAYVLGEVPGKSLHAIGFLHTKLYTFALSVPQIWACVSFIAFFASISVIVWEATNKGWFVRAGVVLSILVFLLHLGGYAYIARDDISESPLLNHTSTSDQIPDGSRLPSIKKSSLITTQHTVYSSEIVQVNSLELQENYDLLYWL